MVKKDISFNTILGQINGGGYTINGSMISSGDTEVDPERDPNLKKLYIRSNMDNMEEKYHGNGTNKYIRSTVKTVL